MTVRGHSVEAWFDDTQAAPFADGDGLAWVAARQRFEPSAGASDASGPPAEPIKIELYGPNHWQSVFVTGPVPTDAGGYWRHISIPTDAVGVGSNVARIKIHNDSDDPITMDDAWVQVSNADATEIIEREGGSVVVDAHTTLTLTLGFQNAHVGTDLSWDADTKSIVTAAGGAYAQNATVLIKP